MLDLKRRARRRSGHRPGDGEHPVNHGV